ncbi:MAG: Mov34/MPN/PAD-1 family protein [Actinomycetota bacterium]|nr:Mov34/MPN/PAD-1 family protein [Actinomycetota bacterium]
MDAFEFRSEDGAFGASISPKTLTELLESCRDFAPAETGGILVGRYNDALNCAVVTDASERPPDSRSGRTWLLRGTAGLQGWLDRLWSSSKRRYYLGEWHFHPGGAPEPSPTDIEQMGKIARSPSYKCPEPVLLLVGGAAEERSDVRVYVFLSKGGRAAPVELLAT